MASRPETRLGLPEFVAIMGMMFATVAFSIDAMLPAMGEIAAELSPEAPQQAQLIITVFVLGMGIGTLFTGPLSDALGRKSVILGSAAIYVASSILAWAASSLELILAARILQGLAAAGPRVAAMAMMRDLYSGRQMAQVVSFAMIVFTFVPAIAPLLGSGIIWLSGWREIFMAFVVFSIISCGWLALRQPETLAPGNRRPFSARSMAAGIAEVLRINRVRLSIAALGFIFGMLFSVIANIQPIFDHSFGRAAEFPYWFAVIALISGSASFLNAHIVMRIGMRRVIEFTLLAELGIAGLLSIVILTESPDAALFPAFIVWMTSVFFVAGLTIGNLNALGMEPLGSLAGLGASIIGSMATVIAVLIAIPVGFAFDGTPLPLAIAVCLCSVCALVLTRFIEDARN